MSTNPLLVPEGRQQQILAEALLRLRARRSKDQLDPNVNAPYDAEIAISYPDYQEKLVEMRSDLAKYAKYVFGYEPARHHKLIIDTLTKLTHDELTNPKTGQRVNKVLLIAPPNTAKSTYVSQIFPPWYASNHPRDPLLFFTSSDMNAGLFDSTFAMTFMESERHKMVFPEPEARPYPKKGWSSDKRFLKGMPVGNKDPNFRAVGYGSAIVGARAHGIIMDDPLDQKRAESSLEQGESKRYYDMTIEPRMQPEGWLVAIMTRWHENDLASHFIKKAEHDGDWLVIVLPMIAVEQKRDQLPDPLNRKPGEALWPERFPADEEEERRKRVGTAIYNCVWQADPTGLGGDIFKSETWFRPFPVDFWEPKEDGKVMVDRLTLVQAWDLAFSEKEAACFTVGVTVGVDAKFRLFVLGVSRKQLSTYGVVDVMAEEIKFWRPHIIVVEESAFRKRSVVDILRQVQQKAFANIKIIKPVDDKVARARLPAGRAEGGYVYVDTDAPWWEGFKTELLGFPRTTYNDQVDALSLACHMVYESPMEDTRPKQIVMRPDKSPGDAHHLRKPLILRI